MSPSSSVATAADVVSQPGLVAEDLSLKLAQLWTRLDAEFVDETGAGSLIHVQSLRLPARTVQRHHELAQEALPQRVLGDEPLELADDVAVATELEIGVDPLREAASRSSSSLRISGWAKFWNANSESAGPRHDSSAHTRCSRRS